MLARIWSRQPRWFVVDRELLQRRKLRILLIEPHAFQLFDIQTLLYDLGCHYLTPAMTHDDLSRVLASATTPFDVAICSVGTFDMSDLELADLVYSTHKVEHLILLSDNEVPTPALLAVQVQRPPRPLLGVLQKPLKPLPMLAMFAKVLAAGSASWAGQAMMLRQA
jgi:CheY-like chemotaxis protein